jgi:hypothetical protein
MLIRHRLSAVFLCRSKAPYRGSLAPANGVRALPQALRSTQWRYNVYDESSVPAFTRSTPARAAGLGGRIPPPILPVGSSFGQARDTRWAECGESISRARRRVRLRPSSLSDGRRSFRGGGHLSSARFSSFSSRPVLLVPVRSAIDSRGIQQTARNSGGAEQHAFSPSGVRPFRRGAPIP